MGGGEFRPCLSGERPSFADPIAAAFDPIQPRLVVCAANDIYLFAQQDDGSLKEAVRLGIRKVNFGTYMKQRYLSAIRAGLSSKEPSPHALLGDGSETDTIVLGRKVVRDAVLERIDLLGCCGKA